MYALILAAMLLAGTPDSSRTEMVLVGKINEEIHITNVLGEEYFVENYMDPVSRIVYFKTDGLPEGIYFLRYGAKSEFLIISQ